MPTPAHETLIVLLSQSPGLLGALAQQLLGAGGGERLAVADSALRLGDPLEVRPDLVLEAGARWVMVEVQAGTDEAKARRWPVAASLLLNKHGAMGDVVVITHSASVAAWSGQVAVLTGPWGTAFALRPRVLLLDEAAARALLATGSPELAFFAAWALQERHGLEAFRLVERAVALTDALPSPLRMAQVRAIFRVMHPQMLKFWRQHMQTLDSLPETPAFKEFREQVQADAQARGMVLGEARALLRLLEKKGFALSEAQRQRVLGCTELAQLEAWLDRVLAAQRLEDVLG